VLDVTDISFSPPSNDLNEMQKRSAETNRLFFEKTPVTARAVRLRAAHDEPEPRFKLLGRIVPYRYTRLHDFLTAKP
jgi:hypothetical protein